LLNEDELIIFNSSKYFNVSEIIDFTWTFEDAGLQVLKGVSPTYVFDTPGIYQVTLVVTDYWIIQP
jgi:PKD repeat protein